jgi:hypothetical protein
MLKLLHCFHGRFLVWMVLVAASFIASRKVAVLVSYATIIDGSSRSAQDTLLPFNTEGAEAFPMGCKSLRVTSDISKLALPGFSVPHSPAFGAFPARKEGVPLGWALASADRWQCPPLQGSTLLRI